MVAPTAGARLERVFAEHRETLVATVTRRTRDVGRAEEAVGDALETGLRRGQSWESDEHCLRWLHVTAMHAAIDQHRRVRRTTVGLGTTILATAASDPTPEHRVLDREKDAALAAAVAELADGDRDLLRRSVEGQPVTSIAAARAMTAGSVATALYRARQRLRTGYEARVAGLAPFFAPWLRRLGQLAPISPAAGVAVGVAATVGVIGLGLHVGTSPSAEATDRRSTVAASTGPDGQVPVLARTDALVTDRLGDAGTGGGSGREDGPRRPDRDTTRIVVPGGASRDVIVPGGAGPAGPARGGVWIRTEVGGTTVEGGADTPLPEQIATDQCVVVDSDDLDPEPGACPAEGGDTLRAGLDADGSPA